MQAVRQVEAGRPFEGGRHGEAVRHAYMLGQAGKSKEPSRQGEEDSKTGRAMKEVSQAVRQIESGSQTRR
jgi:hypothetical protein